MNKCILSGNIATDIELKQTTGGTPVAKFNLAVKRKEEVDFIPIVAWNQQAENVKEFCEKGSKILLEGRIQIKEYEKDAEKHRTTEIVADRIEYLSQSKKTPSEPKKAQKDVFEKFGESLKTESQIGEQLEIDEDDYPF